jgi:hypothetical protein
MSGVLGTGLLSILEYKILSCAEYHAIRPYILPVSAPRFFCESFPAQQASPNNRIRFNNSSI